MTLRQLKVRRTALCRSLFKATQERDAYKRALSRATGKKLCAQLQANLDGYEEDATRYTTAIRDVEAEIEAMEKGVLV